MNLPRVSGPECPNCGCQQSEIIRPAREEGWFASGERRRCENCGRSWCAPLDQDEQPAPKSDPPAPVFWRTVRCPSCNSPDCPVTSTRRPIRFHRCRACGFRFKSVEET